MGVTIKKKIILITIGAIIAPKIIPNLNQSLFKGVSILELINPKTKKIKEIMTDQTLIGSLFIIGHKLTIRKTTKKTRPKFRLELILILLIIFMFQ